MPVGVYLLVLGLMCFFTPMILAFIESAGDFDRWFAGLTLRKMYLVRAMFCSGIGFILLGFAMLGWSVRP